MATRLLLVRHGDSHHKRDAIVGGPKGCRGLTDLGRWQAETLARRLTQEFGSEEERPDAVYSSVIPRAVETAEIIAASLGDRNVVPDCGLCTWHTPAFADGRPWAEYQKQDALTGGGVFRPFERGNESWSELVTRTGRALEEIAARHAGKTSLVVAHAETVNASFIIFGGLPLTLPFETKIAPASLTEWTTDGDPDCWPRPRWTLARFNDSAHTTVSVSPADEVA